MIKNTKLLDLNTKLTNDVLNKKKVLLLADIFENFWNRYFETYKFDPAPLFTAPGLALQAALKETKVKLDLLTHVNILLMVEKRYQRWNMSCYFSILKS